MEIYKQKFKTLILNFLTPKEILFVVGLLSVAAISFVIFLYKTTDLVKAERIIYKGEITEGILGLPKVTNPFQSLNQADKDVATLLYSPLISNLEGKKFDLVLAGKIETNSELTEVKVFISDNARFSDESPITPEDVVYSLQNIPLEKDFATEIVDKKTVLIKFKKNETYPNPLIIFTYPIISKNEKFEGTFTPELITSSPMRIESVSKDSDGNIYNITLERFDNGEIKLPYLKTINMEFFSEEADSVSALQRKELDLLSGVTGVTISKIKEDSSFKISKSELPSNYALFINQNKNDLLQNNRFRQMLSESIDRQTLVNQVLGGFGIPAQNILMKNFKPLDSSITLKNIPSLLFLENGVLYRSNSTESSKKDNKSFEAKEPVKISITTINNKELVETAQFIANSWKKIGVEVTIKKIDRKELQTVVKDRDFDILLFGFGIKNNNDYYSFFSSKERTYPKLNISNYSNKQVDIIVENLKSAKASDEINELKKALSKELESDMPIILLYKPLFLQVQTGTHNIKLPDLVLNEEDRFRHYKNWYEHTENVLKIFVNLKFIDRLDQLLN